MNCLLKVGLCGLLLPVHLIAASSDTRDIGSRRELFVDDYLISELNGASKRLHHPQPQGKALTMERPWEGIYSAYFTVLQDDDVFRMYYRGMPRAKHDLDTEVTCYAESRDGIRWTKPDLNLFEVHGTRKNNVILARHRACHNFSPFIDTNPACPTAAKYKAVGGTGKPGLIALQSPDGIRWKEMQATPVISKGAFDSQNVAFWSETEKQYVCYFRVFRKGVRWIARSTSKDFLNWTEPVDLAFGDGPLQHLYTNQTFPYPRALHLYLGLPTRFMPGRRALTSDQTKRLGTSTAFDFRNDCADILLTSTRGGTGFNRHFQEAYIRPGLDARNWTSRANYAAHGIVETGAAELSVYVNHNVGYPTSHIRRYTIRPDGFVSIYAPFSGGELVTHPFRFDGEQLEINYSTSAAGGIRVAVLNETGEVVPGFELNQCDELIGDELSRSVTWKGNGQLKALEGSVVQLRFALKDADLYSIRFH